MAKKFRWTAIPAQRSSAARLKAKVWTVLGLLIFCALAGVLSFFAWVGNSGGSSGGGGGSPRAAVFAAAAAQDWLAGRPYSVPTASGVPARSSVDKSVALAGAANLTWVSFVIFTQNGATYETDYFAVPGTPPRRLAITTQLTANGPVLAAAPSLEPVKVGSGAQPFEAANDRTVDISSDVTRVVSEWTNAYAADSRQKLKDLTGDPTNRTYAGLGGMTAAQPKVISLVETTGKNMAIARVSFELGSKGFSMPVEYDLLVSEWGTAAPRIQAWGAAGSGPGLVAFQNAGTFVSGATQGGGSSTSTSTPSTTTPPVTVPR